MDEMTKEEMITQLLTDLEQIIKIENAPDKDKEIQTQKTFILAKLESFGVNTENLK